MLHASPALQYPNHRHLRWTPLLLLLFLLPPSLPLAAALPLLMLLHLHRCHCAAPALLAVWLVKGSPPSPSRLSGRYVSCSTFVHPLVGWCARPRRATNRNKTVHLAAVSLTTSKVVGRSKT